MMEIIYFDLDHALNEQKRIITLSGGFHGYKSTGPIMATLDFVKNNEYYPTFSEKVAYLLFSISKNHIFIDGNKRTSIVLASYLMELNGYGSRVGNFIVQMENIIIWVVEGKINRDLLHKIVLSLLQHDEINEEIQLELINSIS